MKLAAKWHGSSSTFFSCPEEGRRVRVKLGGEPADVIRMGKGDPLVLVPGLAGGWKLLLPLARRLAHDFEVILYGLRGDGHPCSGFSRLVESSLGHGRSRERPGLVDRPASARLSRGFRGLVRGGDRTGDGDRVSRSTGCSGRPGNRRQVPHHDRLVDRSPRAGTLSTAD